MRRSIPANIVIPTGLALFAMFFGAGNMIFPIQLGISSGQHLLPAIVAFLISGVGVPFLGLFAVSLYEGSYWNFFKRFGKVPAFLIVTFLILIIGPLFAAPRTEIVTYNTLLPILPHALKGIYLFDLVYFLVVFAAVSKQSQVVDIIGWLLSPVKITAFLILISLGIYTAVPVPSSELPATHVFMSSLTMGYGTMDLLGAFFFCAVAYQYIVRKCHKINITSPANIIKITFVSCVIGAALIGVIYVGLILAAASHSGALQGTATEALIGKIAYTVLGKYGQIFVSVCVSFACLATAIALTEVTADYLQQTIFRGKLPRLVCVVSVLVSMYMMAILGFDTIMKIAVPILNVLYPVLIVMCVVNIAYKLMPGRLVSTHDAVLRDVI